METKSFPKIFALGTRNVKDIFEDSVEITEKIDGSQLGFGLIDGSLVIRSKGAVIDLDKPEGMFLEAVKYIKSIEHKLVNNVFLYGEYLQKPKHNTLIYDRIPKNHIALFAAHFPKAYGGLEFEGEYTELHYWANLLDVDVVPLIYKGYVKDIDKVHEFINRTSFLGGAQIEGIVIKNFHRQCMLTPNVIFPITCAKFVSEHFKEVHRGRWKGEETGKGKWETFCEGYNTPARWDKAIIHLKERGECLDDPRDIGKLLKEINEDIESEEKEIIKDFLWSLHKRSLLSTATRGFPEYYKERLLEGQFA